MALALALPWPTALRADLVSIKVDARQIDFSYDDRYVTLSGNARLFGQVVDDPSRFVKMHASFIEGDLETGRFELYGDVEIITPDGALSGESVRYNTSTSEYWLRRGGVMLPIENERGERVWGYAYAREIESADDVVYITDGRFTTCDSPDPDYVIEVDRIRYDPESWDVTVWGGALRLHGVNIPLLPRLDWNFHGRVEQMSPLYWFVPTYSSRDGLRLQWWRSLRQLEIPAQGRLGIKLTQRRGIRGELQTLQEWGNIAGRLNVTYQEDVRADVDRQTTIDRLPELGVTGVWDGGRAQRVETALWVGEYTQRADPDDPDDVDVTEGRLRVEARYTGDPEARRDHSGAWWWGGGSQAFYADGRRYGWLGAGAGASAKVTDWFSVWAEISHHITDGTTPFEFDDIDIETELAAAARFELSSMWTVGVGGRYDLNIDELRDYTIELRRRDHCLTWTAQYRDVSNAVQLGLEVNGIFGNFEPPEQRSVEDGVPRYWDCVDGVDALRSMPEGDEADAARRTATQTSGARSQP